MQSAIIQAVKSERVPLPLRKGAYNMAGATLYTVIVADDEDELREAVCTMIPWEELGFRLAGSAGNGLDALQLVEKYEPDLLLTDIRMPFISGIELARQVREVRPATNIAFLSGYDDFAYAQQAIQYNIISYMLKPLTMDGLAAELKAIHEKIDARYAGLRRAGSAHADRAALIIPLVLARYENAPENLETRLRQAAVDCGLLRGTDDRSTLVVMAAALDGPAPGTWLHQHAACRVDFCQLLPVGRLGHPRCAGGRRQQPLACGRFELQGAGRNDQQRQHRSARLLLPDG